MEGLVQRFHIVIDYLELNVLIVEGCAHSPRAMEFSDFRLTRNARPVPRISTDDGPRSIWPGMWSEEIRVRGVGNDPLCEALPTSALAD